MMGHHKEVNFEDYIEAYLIDQAGYARGDNKAYDKDKAVFAEDAVHFVKTTQPKYWERLERIKGEGAEEQLISDLVAGLDSQGSLHTLRNGFKCVGKTFKIAYFAPNSGLNEDTQAQYNANIVKVIRQVTTENSERPDMVLSVNGVPVATLELKHELSKTGWNVQDAITQYKFERNPNGRLYEFKKRALVHFAVDSNEVYMTTRLAGGDTRFLPFNRGHDDGKGNPPVDGKHRTYYLWENVLTKDSLMDILGRFLHLKIEEKKIKTKSGYSIKTTETMIFPRFHQLDAVRQLVSHSREYGAGRNYLIQHSAGSGKSNTIAWLSHQLSSLYDKNDQKVFNSIIVVTDRVVLDKQLQDTVAQFEQTDGVVKKIDKDTHQLVTALASGVPIIITTIHKFPYIMSVLDKQQQKGVNIEIDTKDKRFAVVVDEAHSSQSGEMASELRKVLNRDGIESAIIQEFLDDDGDDGLADLTKQELYREQCKRQRQPNLSFFAFTATPKWKTLALFDEVSPVDGKSPFHRYSMKQAIEEGFIMDVLENYTTYSQYFEILKVSDVNLDLSKNKTKAELTRFALLHNSAIAQKVEIIVEHFYHHTRTKIGGRAKAMVVTSSRRSAVQYKLAFDQYIKEKGYTDIKSLVAFSGGIKLDGSDKEYTEVIMNNGIKETELPEYFDSDDYQVLLVADKYQTGFDQPLLHTMFVDKKLSGIQAVQTLSRLNRKASGKVDTFVMDFVNHHEDIYKAFKPYYQTTQLGQVPDVDKLNSLAHTIDEYKIYTHDEIMEFAEIWFAQGLKLNKNENARLNAVVDKAVERYKNLTANDESQKESKQLLFKSQIASYIKLYQFVSQIITYGDTEHEIRYLYLQSLLAKLPKGSLETKIDLSKLVVLKYYRLQQIVEGSIDLKNGEASPLKGSTDVGTGKPNMTEELHKLINELNDAFSTEFTIEDQLFFDSVEEFAQESEEIQNAVKYNSLSVFLEYFKDSLLEEVVLKMFDKYQESATKILNDEQVKKKVAKHLGEQIYEKVKNS